MMKTKNNSNKIYLAALIIITFLLGMIFEYYRCLMLHNESMAGNEAQDTAEQLKNTADSFLRVDTLYLQSEQRKKLKTKIAEYVTDTLAPALSSKPSQSVEQQIIMSPITISGQHLNYDTIIYLQHILDSVQKECSYYQSKYYSLVLSSKTQHDTVLVDTNISITFKSRWEYSKLAGIKLNRVGYTDVYYGGKQPLSIPQDQNQFGIRLQGIVSYSPRFGQFSLGGALRFDAKSYQGTFIYYYNIQQHKFVPVISLNKDILRIR